MLTIEEVAKQLNVSRRTVDRYIQKKKLIAIKYDKAIRVSQEDIDKFKQERRTG